MQTATEQRRAFAIWLRTGRRLRLGEEGAIEVKFNPWHDPANGQFTSAGRGQASGARESNRQTGGRAPPKGQRAEVFRPGGAERGFGGGGAANGWGPTKAGVFRPGGAERGAGGGGATGSWGTVSAQVNQARHGQRRATDAVVATGGVLGQTHGSWRHVSRNGYDYEIDERGRTRQVSGQLVLTSTQPRSRSLQRSAGGADRLPKDDGGHYIAPRFNGPTEAFNHFAQDASVNRGKYRALEDQWARAKRLGSAVTVKIVPHFGGTSQRPRTIDVVFTINGRENSVKLPNERAGGHHGH